MRIFLLILTALLFNTSLFANEDKAIKDILLKYNYGIVHMGKTGEVDHFKSFMSKEAAIKLQVWFESWKFSNLTIIANINDLRFSPIAYNENNVTIRTLENWTYAYADLVKRDYALEPTTIFYKMRYTLKKHHGQWIIVGVENLQEETFVKPNTHKPSVEEKKKKPLDDSSGENSKGKIETH